MKKILLLFILICNGMFANRKVQLFDTNIENSFLIDFLLNCCENYMKYEYGNLENNEKYSIYLQILTDTNLSREYIFTVYDAFTNDEIYDLEENCRLFLNEFKLYFYDFSSMSVLIGMEDPKCELQNNDSTEVLTKRNSIIYLRIKFVETDNSCDIVEYDNFKVIMEPDEYRCFNFENDTFFTYGRSNEYPFENPYEGDTSVIYLDREESAKCFRKKMNLDP